jgi:protoporphyrinogen/coproporphyrinogen III oxidase
MSSRGTRVAVLGGGVAGLATAYRIRRGALRANLPLELDLFEREQDTGGKLRSRRDDGFLVEEGPNGFLDNEPATLRLLRDLGLDDQLQRSDENASHRFLLVGGRLRELPMSPPAFLKSDILPLGAKLRMAAELLLPRRPDLGRAAIDPAADESVDAFGRRRLGKAFAETLLDPMVKGIFGGDSRQLSLEACFPKMVTMEQEHGGLFRAMIATSRARKRAARRGEQAAPGGPAGPAGVLHSFRDGMAALPDALVAELSDAITTGVAVDRVERRDGDWWLGAGDREWGPFDAVVDATPAHAAARHHAGDPELSSLLSEIPYAPMAVITLAFDRAELGEACEGFGMLIPTAERRRLLGVLWSASIFRGRAPEDRVILRCMAGGAADPHVLEQSDDQLLAMTLDEVAAIHGRTLTPARVWIIRHEKAIAQYRPGHLARLSAIEAARIRRPGLFFTGSAYRGVSVNHCIAESERVAAALLRQLSIERPDLRLEVAS